VECDLFVRSVSSIKPDIDFSEQNNIIQSSISTAINAILREFETSCDPSFATLSRTSWSTVNQVSGQSPYTDELVKSAEQLVVVIKPLVEQKKYLKNFFDKACRSALHPSPSFIRLWLRLHTVSSLSSSQTLS
jgi:hypothetical protein